MLNPMAREGRIYWPATAAALVLITCAGVRAADRATDMLDFGHAGSEREHALTALQSDTGTGQMGEPMRRLLPLASPTWEGGRLAFTMKVDPDRTNYFTARFSGDEVNENRLLLIADGKQIGWRHLGEIDQLDFGTWAAAVPGRWYYDTFPLPESITHGKTEVHFQIRSSGRLWPYGQTFDKFQNVMTTPSRGLYRVYTTTDGFFIPPVEEKQGGRPADAPAAAAPGSEVLDAIKNRVNAEIDARLNASNPISQTQMQLLAKAYDIAWTHAYRNPKAIEQIVKALDNLYAGYEADPKLANVEPSTWNPDWFGLGLCGQALWLRQSELRPLLDQPIAGGDVTRRTAYTDMLVACRDWHRLHRRGYTNQTILNDTNGIYLANRGIEVTDPAKALREDEARRYLYESVSLQPWRDSDAGGTSFHFGGNYFQLTDNGLTRELGYVGTYGEVIDLIGLMYEATKPSPNEPGDPKIREQLIKAAKARSNFRYPEVDADGHRVMRLEQIIGWRDLHYPGEVAYAQRATRDASALQAAALTLDPDLVGYAKQQIADNQLFASEVEAMDDKAQPLRTTIGRLETPDEYALISAQPPSPAKLPMSPGNGDYLFTDEQDGVVALKHGDDLLYVSLYWRARFGINDLARVHHVTPHFDRIAVVHEDTRFTPSGQTYAFPNVMNTPQVNRDNPKYPGYTVPSAYTGITQPIAKFPADVPFTPGRESPFAGKGDFYTLRYGPYLIGMNMTTDRTFELKVPAAKGVQNLSAKDAPVSGGATLNVGPQSTAVLLVQD